MLLVVPTVLYMYKFSSLRCPSFFVIVDVNKPAMHQIRFNLGHDLHAHAHAHAPTQPIRTQ
jgi:hypothetical protein